MKNRPEQEESVRAAKNAVHEFESATNHFEDIRAMALRFPGEHDSETGYTLRLRVRNRVTEIDRVNASFNEFAEPTAMAIAKPATNNTRCLEPLEFVTRSARSGIATLI